MKKLAGRGERFVLVFGSVRALDGKEDITGTSGVGMAIRFIHKGDDAPSELVLNEIAIVNGDRFYGILRPPKGASYVDHFDAQVRWGDPAYDVVTHLKLREPSGPIAIYLGEIEVQVAGANTDPQRLSPKRILSIQTRDNFEPARTELARLYPKFTGEVRRTPLLGRGRL